MRRTKLPTDLKKAANEFVSLSDAAREAGNAVNRQKTKLRNAVKAFWATEKLPHGSYILTNGLKVKYEAAESEKLSTERIFEMLDDEEITRDQAIRMLNVDKTEATNILGGDIVADITYTEVGKKADIRIEKLPIEQLDEEAVVAAQKRSRVRRRKIGRKQQQESTPARPKRRVKVRNND